MSTEIYIDEKARLRRLYESRAREGESCRIMECPHCHGDIAIYIRETNDAPPIEPAAEESNPAD